MSHCPTRELGYILSDMRQSVNSWHESTGDGVTPVEIVSGSLSHLPSAHHHHHPPIPGYSNDQYAKNCLPLTFQSDLKTASASHSAFLNQDNVGSFHTLAFSAEHK